MRQGQHYLKAWDALGQMLLEGRSWSGHEANVAFLNLGNEAFSPCAGVAGLNLVADSRGVAVTDWDRDGDLDLWFSHRTGPRVSHHENRTPNHGRSVSFQLEGVESNRDAIGARVEVRLKGRSKRLLRTLRAGEGYLSQSSKTMVIGLPDNAVIERVEVLWPAGTREVFAQVTPGGRFRLVEGRGRAAVLTPSAVTANAGARPSQEAAPASSTPAGRIIPHAPLPLPSLPYTLDGGIKANLYDVRKPTFVTLWASWCQPCLQELQAFSQAAGALQESGLAVLCVNVEQDPESGDRGSPRLPFLPDAFLTGHAGQDFLEQLDVVQRALISPEPGLALPSSFLLDAAGRLTAFYRGPVTPRQVLLDRRRAGAGDIAHRDLAVPFPGTWLMASLPVDLLAIPERLTAIDRAADAFDYLERHVTGDRVPATEAELPSRALSLEDVSKAYDNIGKALEKQSSTALMRRAWERAVSYAPRAIERRAALAIHYESARRWAAAIGHYRILLEQEPKHLAARNSLAWILATAPEPALRHPAEAIKLAYAVCQATEMNQPEPLDTLGGALAAAGRFDDAIRAVERGIALADQTGRADVAEAMRHRLELYRRNQAFVEAPE